MTSGTASVPALRYSAVTFDCPDPAELGRFYGDALGLPVLYSSEDFVLIGHQGAPALGFNRVADHRPPSWPDRSGAKQAHLDFAVDDLDAAQARLVELGAVLPEFQPDPDRWRVLVDPAGHPFCVSTLA
ncbi:VOC family protein [Kitasatospora sp. NPDC059646]|uniref:VOC family protein n=1 Tax=Kitasatospora sp. NPDC059646 TaxID=3346893 RepID=UPI00369038F5